MPEVIFFPDRRARLEGPLHPPKKGTRRAIASASPPPLSGAGTMNHKSCYNMHYAFYNMGFTVLRFNFRGGGRSQGDEYDQGSVKTL